MMVKQIRTSGRLKNNQMVNIITIVVSGNKIRVFVFF